MKANKKSSRKQDLSGMFRKKRVEKLYVNKRDVARNIFLLELKIFLDLTKFIFL